MLPICGAIFEATRPEEELTRLEVRAAAQDFWKDQAEAQQVQQRRRRLEPDRDLILSLRKRNDALAVLVEWSQAGGPGAPAFAAGRPSVLPQVGGGWSVPRTSAATASAPSSAPTQSSRFAFSSRLSGMKRTTRTRAISTTGALIRKMEPQSKWLRSHPARSGRSGRPMKMAAPEIAIARRRSAYQSTSRIS